VDKINTNGRFVYGGKTMNNFTIIDLSGKILHTGFCSNPEDLMLQAQDGQHVLNFMPDVEGATHWNFETREFYRVEEPEIDPDEGLTAEQLVAKYWLFGAAYVEKYLNSDQKTQLLQISAMDVPPLKSVQDKIQTCITWITLMQADCFANPKAFKPENHGDCPYSYFEMYSEYLAVISPILKSANSQN
jgi:hypothetical protein